MTLVDQEIPVQTHDYTDKNLAEIFLRSFFRTEQEAQAIKDGEPLTVAHVFGFQLRLQKSKSEDYGPSWCRRGEETSIAENLGRHYDRIQNILVGDGDPSEVTWLSEAATDLSAYGAMYATWLGANRPEDTEQWLDELVEYASEDIEDSPKQYELDFPETDKDV